MNIFKKGQSMCVSTSTLFKKYGSTLRYARIEATQEGEQEYYDLLNTYGQPACLDGECCIVVSTDSDSVEFCCVDNETRADFRLSFEEAKTAVFM